MGINSLAVRLEPHQGVYLPGQTVMGSVLADVSSEVSCRAVELKFKGKAEVRWTESNGSDNSSSVYTASEPYFNFKVNVWTSQGSSGKLPTGNHVWPFNFNLPQNIPSSFEGPYGFVRYSIEVNADIPFGFDKTQMVYISINCPFDLNFSSQAVAPLVMKTTDTSCYLCCTKGPVSININCQHSGAVVGECFKVRGEVNNQGSSEVEKVTVALIQKMKFHARGHTKKFRSNVTTLEKGAIAPGDSCYFNDDPLLVRAVVPMLFQCHIIDLAYELEVTAYFGCCRKVEETCDFFVGTVPFFTEGGSSGYPVGGPSAPLDYGSKNYPAPSAPALNVPFNTEADNFGATRDDPPPYVEVASPSVPESFWGPPPPAAPPNQYPNRRPPVTKSCWFCESNRRRLDKKAPAPAYLSYLNCF